MLLLAGAAVATGFLGKAKPIAPEKIVPAERGDIARSVVARGKIEPLSKVEVKSKANGIIKALLVDVGDRVTEGQILAELDKEDLEAQVREAKATRDGEEANLHAAIAEWRRNTESVPGIVGAMYTTWEDKYEAMDVWARKAWGGKAGAARE